MAGTNRFYLGSPNLSDHEISGTRLKPLAVCPWISAELSIAGTGVTSMVSIPPGAIVYRVGLWNNGAVAIATADIDVGDGTVADKYLDGVSVLAVNDIAMSGLGGAAGADPVGGAYYASGGTIAVDVNTAQASCTVKVLVWYTTAS